MSSPPIPCSPPLSALALTLSAVLGCAPLSAESLPGQLEDPDAEACEHLGSGPFSHQVAGGDLATAPDLSASHLAHRVDLLPVAGGYQGLVSIAARDAGDLAIYLDTRTELTLTDAAGAVVSVEERCPASACSASCTTVADRYLVELSVGSYALQLGPTSAPTVTLVHEASGDHHEHAP